MGLNFRKSITLFKGVKLNLSKGGPSLSFGRSGLRQSINLKGQGRTTIGIPGTGVYYTKNTNVKKLVKQGKEKIAELSGKKKGKAEEAAALPAAAAKGTKTTKAAAAKAAPAAPAVNPELERNQQLVAEFEERIEAVKSVHKQSDGYIDWEAVARAGYSFAFIRVGYRGYGEAGSLNEDAAAIDNLRCAKAAGLRVGTYIFSQALNEEEARAEADLAVGVITSSGVETDLPLMYDPELIKDDWGRANDITREQVSLNTAAFRDQVEKTSTLTVDIYSNLPWEHHYFDTDTMNQFKIWYADYEKAPQTPYHFAWWQYTNEGHVPGIDGEVDLNVWLCLKDA